MKAKNLMKLIIFIAILISCGKEEVFKHYESGEIREQRIYDSSSDTANYNIVYFYKNSQVRMKGKMNNSSKVGHWIEYYEDGAIKWTGEYNNNKRQAKLTSLPIIEFNDSVLHKGKASYLRVRADGVHPKEIAVACTNGNVKVANNNNCFDYIVTPKKDGMIKFIIYHLSNGEMVKIGTDSLIVHPF